jgi:hypothetical protein
MAKNVDLLVSGYTLRTVLRGKPKDKQMPTGSVVNHGCNQLSPGKDADHFWGASTLAQRVFEFRAATGRITRSVFVDDPQGVAGHSDGRAFYVDLIKGQVFELPSGSDTPVAVTGVGALEVPTQINLNASENKLYVGSFAGGVFEIDISGGGGSYPVTPTTILANGPVGPVLNDYLGPVMPDDQYLYYARTNKFEINRLDVIAKTEIVLKTGLIADTLMDADGVLYYMDLLSVFNPPNFEETIFRVPKPPSGPYTAPIVGEPFASAPFFPYGFQDVAIWDRDGDSIISSNLPDNALLRHRRRQAPSIWSFVTPKGQTIPGGLAAISETNGRSSFYLADIYKVSGFDGQGGVELWQTPQIAEFVWPHFTTPLDDTTIVVGGFFVFIPFLATMDRFTGEFIAGWFRPDDRAPMDVCVLDSDNLCFIEYEVDFGTLPAIPVINPKLKKLTMSTGVVVDLTATLAAEDPTGIMCDGTNVFYTNRTAGELKLLGSVADILGEVGLPLTPTVKTSGLTKPEGCDVDSDLTGLVVEVDTGVNGGRLKRVNLSTGAVIETVLDGLPVGLLDPPNAGFARGGLLSDVAVDAAGNIYVSLDESNEVLRLTPNPS